MKLNIHNTSLRISAGETRQFPRDPLPQIAFSGRSNVGKSSLINSLLGRKSLARVSATPGKTITVNFYEIDKKLFFVDLPGYGFAQRSETSRRIWAKVSEDYFLSNENRSNLKLVIQLIDSRIGPSEDDLMMIRFLSESRIPYIIVSTKSDKLSSAESQALPLRLLDRVPDPVAVIPYSVPKKIGREAVWREIMLSIDKNKQS